MSSAIYWESVCGHESQQNAFWSEAISVNTSTPDFTRCFQDTVLAWGTCGYLWVCALFYIPYLAGRETFNTCSGTSTFNKVKVAFGVILALVSVLDLIKVILEYNDANRTDPEVALWIKPIIYTLTMVLAAFIMHYEYRKGEHSGGVIFMFWLLMVTVNIVPFRSYIINITYDQGSPVIEDKWRFVTFFLFYALIVLQLLLHCFVDLSALPDSTGQHLEDERRPLLVEEKAEQEESFKDAPPSPELRAHFISRLFFFWISRMMIMGYKRDLIFEDMWNLSPSNQAKTAVPQFEDEWEKELEKAHFKLLSTERVKEASKERGTIPDGLGVGGKKPTSTYTDVQYKSGSDGESKKKAQPSVWYSICRGFGGYYLIGGLYKLIYDIVTFINPQVLNLLITYVGTSGEYQWKGFLYAAVLFSVSMFRTIILQQYWDACFVVGLRLRSAVIGTVYRKSLRLTSKARQSASVGEIVNLMSVDAQKFQDAPAYMHMVWSTPLTIGVAVYFLWQQLGPSVLAGLGVMILLIPINGVIAQKTRKLQISQMLYKDERIKLMNEILNGVKVLKLYAWEDSFAARVLGIREKELKVLKSAQYLSAASAISWFMAPYLVALATFGVFVMSSEENILDANKAFVSLSLFNILNYPMSILPAVLNFGVQGAVSISRISKFLKNEEIDPDNVHKDPTVEEAVRVDNGTFSWGSGESSILKNINLRVPDGQLVAVVGTVGTGKSSLLSAMLGEMELVQGRVNVKGKVAYVPQQAWIQNATLRDNITFGQKFTGRKYESVIEACALAPDLKILPGGDQTEIGEKGINLSGGQKQRVSLARAVYQNADVYLLDDPLSAVDSHVGKHIFENIVGPDGMLSHKTRVLVTNGIGYLSKMDSIIVLKEGEISEMGSFQELLNHNGDFADFINTYLNEAEENEDEDQDMVEMKKELRRHISVISQPDDEGKSQGKSVGKSSVSGSDKSRRRSRRSMSRADDAEAVQKEIEKNEEREKNKKLIAKEEAMTGNVKLAVFSAYIRACGVGTFSLAIVFYIIYLASQIGTNIWLSLWSGDPPTANGTQNLALRDLRLGVYGGLGGVQAIGVLGMAFAIAIMCVKASRVLHFELMSNILRAPMAFFDTTPLGRIVNRFSRDVDTVDVNLPMTIRIWTGTFSGVVTTIVVISYSTPIFLSVVVPLFLFYYFVQRFYISTSRQLKRIDSIVRSPIYAHFGETISGISSIRAYERQHDFILKSDKHLDANQMVYYPTLISNRWLGLWLEFIGNLIVLFAGIFAVLEKDSISPGLAGLSVSYALQVTGALNMVVRMSSDLETYVVAVERIKEYAECPKEAPSIVENNRPARHWPDSGAVEFVDYGTRYRPGLDLVLKGIDCQVNPGEKVGIVGRTGAGKSSLTLALFRIIEASMGRINIDNVNISNIGLKDLRSKLTIIPQDPVLFSGTLRMNLDPFESQTDNEVWDSLKQAHLKDYVMGLAAGLQHECTEGGENLSVGQRQLVCLARALLRKTKILVLDEATAAIDLETDDLIQETIRTEFKECTVITIAHRLNTIMDYDRVMVLDKGKIEEYDNPTKLKQDSNTIFYGMVKDAGLI